MTTMTSLFLLTFIFLLSYCIAENYSAEVLIERQFQAIRSALVSGNVQDRNYLVYSLPEMPGKWDEIFAIGNYIIKSAQHEKNGSKIFGAVEFLFPEEKKKRKIRAFTYVTLIAEPRSKSGWTISITETENTSGRRRKHVDSAKLLHNYLLVSGRDPFFRSRQECIVSTTEFVVRHMQTGEEHPESDGSQEG